MNLITTSDSNSFTILRSIDPQEAGRYRQLDFKAAGSEYLYPAHYLLTDLMGEFILWLNSAEAKTLHPLEYAAQAHFRFVSIHPFRDGNGRTGRLLMNLILLRAGYLIVVISNQVRKAYIDAIIDAQHRVPILVSYSISLSIQHKVR